LFEPHLKSYCSAFFSGLDVEFLSESRHPAVSLQGRPCKHQNIWGHRQYEAKTLASIMKRAVPDVVKDSCFLVGVTMEDMCTEWSSKNEYSMPGVTFGMTGTAPLSLASFATICPTFKEDDGIPAAVHEDEYGREVSAIDSLTNSAKVQWVLQALRITSHEICHGLGLQHCFHYQCLMNTGIQRDDDVGSGMFLCPICLRKLLYVLGYPDPIERYTAMLKSLHDIVTAIGGDFQSFQDDAAKSGLPDREPADPRSSSSNIHEATLWLEHRLARISATDPRTNILPDSQTTIYANL